MGKPIQRLHPEDGRDFVPGAVQIPGGLTQWNAVVFLERSLCLSCGEEAGGSGPEGTEGDPVRLLVQRLRGRWGRLGLRWGPGHAENETSAGPKSWGHGGEWAMNSILKKREGQGSPGFLPGIRDGTPRTPEGRWEGGQQAIRSDLPLHCPGNAECGRAGPGPRDGSLEIISAREVLMERPLKPLSGALMQLSKKE